MAIDRRVATRRDGLIFARGGLPATAVLRSMSSTFMVSTSGGLHKRQAWPASQQRWATPLILARLSGGLEA